MTRIKFLHPLQSLQSLSGIGFASYTSWGCRVDTKTPVLFPANSVASSYARGVHTAYRISTGAYDLCSVFDVQSSCRVWRPSLVAPRRRRRLRSCPSAHASGDACRQGRRGRARLRIVRQRLSANGSPKSRAKKKSLSAILLQTWLSMIIIGFLLQALAVILA